MQTAARGAQAVNPGNLTGVIFKRQQAEQTANKAAAGQVIDLAAIKRQAFEDGYSAAFDKAFIAGWEALRQHLVDVGVLDADDDQGDEDQDGADE